MPQTYYFSEQNHILSSHDEYTTGDVAKFFPHVNSLNCLVKHQIGWGEKRGWERLVKFCTDLCMRGSPEMALRNKVR